MLGLEEYEIEFEKVVISKDLKKISGKDKKNIKKAIVIKLQTDPISYSFPLKRPLGNYRKLRVGKYRIIFNINDKEKKCRIIGIKHRQDIYKNILDRTKINQENNK